MREIVLPAVTESIPKAMAWIDGELEKLECAPKAQMHIDLLMDEILVNVASYAYPDHPGDVTCQASGKSCLSVLIPCVGLTE